MSRASWARRTDGFIHGMAGERRLKKQMPLSEKQTTGKGMSGLLLKGVDPSLENGYTGYKSSRFTNYAATLGTLGVAGAIAVGSGSTKAFGGDGSGISGLGRIPTKGEKMGQVSYGGTPGIMNADGVGSVSQAPTLGATGDLVLGLHNGRKG